MQRDDIALLKKVRKFNTTGTDARAALTLGYQHLHPERPRQFRYSLPDAAKTDDTPLCQPQRSRAGCVQSRDPASHRSQVASRATCTCSERFRRKDKASANTCSDTEQSHQPRRLLTTIPRSRHAGRSIRSYPVAVTAIILNSGNFSSSRRPNPTRLVIAMVAPLSRSTTSSCRVVRCSIHS